MTPYQKFFTIIALAMFCWFILLAGLAGAAAVFEAWGLVRIFVGTAAMAGAIMLTALVLRDARL